MTKEETETFAPKRQSNLKANSPRSSRIDSSGEIRITEKETPTQPIVSSSSVSSATADSFQFPKKTRFNSPLAARKMFSSTASSVDDGSEQGDSPSFLPASLRNRSHKKVSKKSLSSAASHDGSLKSTSIISSSHFGKSVKTSGTETSKKEEDRHDRKVDKGVRRLKFAILVFFTLTAAVVTVAFCVYRASNINAQKEEFRSIFKTDAENVLASLGMNIDSTLASIDAFVVSMLAYAKATNQTYPFVTIEDYDVQAGKLLKNSRAKYITTYMLVQEDQREAWEAYTPKHNGWINETIEVQMRDRSYTGPELSWEYVEENYLGHYDLIHGYDADIYGGNQTNGVEHGGPYLPIWQCVPVIPVDPVYNWDLLSQGTYLETPMKVLETHLVSIGEPYMIAWPNDTVAIELNQAEADWFSVYLEEDERADEPVVDIYYPIIPEALDNVHHREEDFTQNYDPQNNTVGGIFGLSLYWRDALRDLLPNGSSGVVIVFENYGCGAPPFAYEVKGSKPRYLEAGIYESEFADDPELVIEVSLMDIWEFGVAETAYTGIPINPEVCPYTIKLYPAEDSYEAFRAKTDNTVYIVLLLVLSVAVVTIAFTLLFFFIYDRLVRGEIHAKKNLLEAKRNFVRFVSHEVRTPLNTVSMGLTLIQQDIKSSQNKLAKSLQTDDDDDAKKKGAVSKEDLARWASLTEEVNHSADVAVGVLNDLLNIDKIQMGSFRLEMEMLPIWDLIEQTALEFKVMANKQRTDLKIDLTSLAEQNDVESSITTASMLPETVLEQKLVGDEQRIKQVLRNLLSNAIKFSKNRSVTVKVSASDDGVLTNKNEPDEFKLTDGTRVGVPMSGRLVVDVIDTGVGMTPQQLETVFDVGTQFNAKSLQSGGGSGLGLAFAKAIAEQHNGSLTAYSEGRDKGTTFRLALPLHHSDAAQVIDTSFKPGSNGAPLIQHQPKTRSKSIPGSSISKQPDTVQEESLEPMHMMVVDDALSNRKLLIRLLQMNGHSCGEAENGQALIDKIAECLNDDSDSEKTRQYDCILVDYEMPIMNGPEACKAIREMGYDGFVVGVTGNLLPEDVEYFMSCGANAVLPKPFKYKELEQLLMEHGLFVEGW